MTNIISIDEYTVTLNLTHNDFNRMMVLFLREDKNRILQRERQRATRLKTHGVEVKPWSKGPREIEHTLYQTLYDQHIYLINLKKSINESKEEKNGDLSLQSLSIETRTDA
jgi:hypothetical protein